MESVQQLSREAIEDFKAIYELEFGEMLSDAAAQEMALRVLRLFALLAKPLPSGASGQTIEPENRFRVD
jgi:hypothetical protein